MTTEAAGLGLVLHTFTRWWPDGTYCPDGRDHVAWTTIQTTASDVTMFGTDGPVAWCGCGQPAWVAAAETLGAK